MLLEANTRPEVHEPNLRLSQSDESAKQDEVQSRQGLWQYIGQVHEWKVRALIRGGLYGTPSEDGNQNRKVLLNVQESAEVIVPSKGRLKREGPNVNSGMNQTLSRRNALKQNS